MKNYLCVLILGMLVLPVFPQDEPPPATEAAGQDKIKLIKNLAKKRFLNDPIAQVLSVVEYIDSLPDTQLMGLPEATIVTIVETYWQSRNQGLSDKEIFEAIENHRAIIGAGTIPSPLTLSTYIKYRVGLEHSGGAPISEIFIDEAIKEATAYYEVLPDTVFEVFENRAIWEEFPRPFLEALSGKFDSAEVASNFAVLCEESGILENNIRRLSEYLDPEFGVGAVAVALTSYGNTMGGQGEIIKAKEGLEFALVLNPNYVPAWLSMAIVSVNLGDCTSAVDWADKSLNFQPDPNSENSWDRAMAATENFSNELRDQMEAIKAACK